MQEVRWWLVLSYCKNQDEMMFTKYVYDTKETLEQFVRDTTTGN